MEYIALCARKFRYDTQSTLAVGQLPISPDCVFDASLVPGTCPGRFLDLKGLINKFLESRRNIKGRPWWSRVLSASSTAPEEERPL